METLIKDRRQDIEGRAFFDKAISDLKEIISCYDVGYFNGGSTRYKVVIDYLNTHHLYMGNDSIRGRVICVLGVNTMEGTVV